MELEPPGGTRLIGQRETERWGLKTEPEGKVKRGSRETDAKKWSREEELWRSSFCETDKGLELVIEKRSITPWPGLGNQPSGLEVQWMDNKPCCFQGPGDAVLRDTQLLKPNRAQRNMGKRALRTDPG